MGKIGTLATIVVCSAAILGGIVYMTRSRSDSQKSVPVVDKAAEEASLRLADRLLSEGKVDEALKVIHRYEDQISIRTVHGRAWLDLLVEACVKTGNYSQLIILYEAYPRAFEDNEKASIMVANGYILAKQPQKYQSIRQNWIERGTEKDVWLALDADNLLLEGKKQEALQLLKSIKLEGKKDINRLVRLALLYVVDNPKASWDYLAEAYNLDSQDPDILTYRAKLLESLGKDSLALYEYLAAIQAAPDNLFLRDQLAEFYMRRNDYMQAFAVWLATLSKPSLDLIWMKLLFWSKVVSPIKFDWSAAVPPAGSDKAFIEYLISLPSGVFWDNAAFDRLSNGKTFLSNLEITFWLRLLELFKSGNEKDAYALLKFNKFSEGKLNPQLEKAVKQILSYRMNGSLNFDVAIINKMEKTSSLPLPTGEKNSSGIKSFFSQLDDYANSEYASGNSQKLPQELHDVLMSKDAFSIVFLAGGWLEAALELRKMPVLPNTFPDWIAYGFTEALRANRSPAEAIEFAIKQKKTPSLSLLIGELYISESKYDEALAVLQPYLQENTDIGQQAAWLTSVIFFDKQDFKKAKDILNAHPNIAESIAGREALARMALAEGDTELADKLYTQLWDQSPEAMSYLARKAYAEKKWQRAQELTEQLLLMFPDSPILRENLNKIIEEQKVQQVK